RASIRAEKQVAARTQKGKPPRLKRNTKKGEAAGMKEELTRRARAAAEKLVGASVALSPANEACPTSWRPVVCRNTPRRITLCSVLDGHVQHDSNAFKYPALTDEFEEMNEENYREWSTFRGRKELQIALSPSEVEQIESICNEIPWSSCDWLGIDYDLAYIYLHPPTLEFSFGRMRHRLAARSSCKNTTS
ncbi:hypothetical protein GN958_ATG22945, partial [Phytophthora infestans]